MEATQKIKYDICFVHWNNPRGKKNITVDVGVLLQGMMVGIVVYAPIFIHYIL
jgi:hypothetical protein